MQDQQLLQELENVVLQPNEQQEKYLLLIQQIIQCSNKYGRQNIHWQGISLLAKARQVIHPRSDLDRSLALALGGKAELVMKWSDMLRVAPSKELLIMMEGDLQQAIRVDATLADPFWDLAVINARYYGDYNSAAIFLKQAVALGYHHPMMENLSNLIQAEPPVQQVPDTKETKLRQLLLNLAVQATGPMEPELHIEEESTEMGDLMLNKSDLPAVRTFGDYTREAKKIVINQQLPLNVLRQILNNVKTLQGDSAEYVADLVRRVADVAEEVVFLIEATHWHLQVILQMAFCDIESLKNDSVRVKRSLKTVRRGLKIIDQSEVPIDFDLHAEFLLAEGQALYYIDEHHAIEAIKCYWRALTLKRKAENTADVERLTRILWEQIDYRRGRAIISFHMGGIGQAMEILKVCFEVASDLNDSPHAMAIGVDLAGVLRQAGQFFEAEEILIQIISYPHSAEILFEARFELASVYSETFRPNEAAQLQFQLITDGVMPDDQKRAILWSNYANSLSLLNDFEGARAALQKAWDLMPEDKKRKTKDTFQLESARIKMLFAELQMKTGNYAEALGDINEAEELNPTPFGLYSMYFNEIKARCLMALKRYDEALHSLDTFFQNFWFLLQSGPSLSSWESLLKQWSHVDTTIIHLLLADGKEDRFENALLRAECAKGRISAWLAFGAKPEMAQQALSLEKQADALKEVKNWIRDKPKRRVISLFGSKHGLGIFEVDEKGGVNGGWLHDFNYDLFRTDIYDPWESNLEYALSEGNQNGLAMEGSLLNYMLDLVGNWLWQVCPSLVDGGSDLVILPHRLFRRLPLAHVRLPNSKRLSDLFDTVVINPSLANLGRGLKSSLNKAGPANVFALANADSMQPLPFASCEAILSGAGENLRIGSAATVEALSKAFEHEGTLLLSLHGDFDETNPFQSKIFTADGYFSLHQLFSQQTSIKSRIVVLGVCEGGRSRRSLSDEPVGFPAMLLQLNAQVVLAPAWQVDDFASCLFLSKFFNSMKEGADVFHAVSSTAKWLRELKAEEAINQVNDLINKVLAFGETGKSIVEDLKPNVEKQISWLETLTRTDRPFRSPLDWAAFQITGIPQ